MWCESILKAGSIFTISYKDERILLSWAPYKEPWTIMWLRLALKGTIFWDVMLCSLGEVYSYYRQTYCLHFLGWWVSQVSKQQAYSLILKMETVHAFEMLVNFYQTTRHYTSLDCTLHGHSCENIKSHKTCSFLRDPTGYILSTLHLIESDLVSKMLYSSSISQRMENAKHNTDIKIKMLCIVCLITVAVWDCNTPALSKHSCKLIFTYFICKSC